MIITTCVVPAIDVHYRKDLLIPILNAFTENIENCLINCVLL